MFTYLIFKLKVLQPEMLKVNFFKFFHVNWVYSHYVYSAGLLFKLVWDIFSFPNVSITTPGTKTHFYETFGLYYRILW